MVVSIQPNRKRLYRQNGNQSSPIFGVKTINFWNNLSPFVGHTRWAAQYLKPPPRYSIIRGYNLLIPITLWSSSNFRPHGRHPSLGAELHSFVPPLRFGWISSWHGSVGSHWAPTSRETNRRAVGVGKARPFWGDFFLRGKNPCFFLIYVCWICILYIYIKMIRIMNMRMMMLKIQNPVITLMRIIMIQNMMVMQDQYHKMMIITIVIIVVTIIMIIPVIQAVTRLYPQVSWVGRKQPTFPKDHVNSLTIPKRSRSKNCQGEWNWLNFCLLSKKEKLKTSWNSKS